MSGPIETTIRRVLVKTDAVVNSASQTVWENLVTEYRGAITLVFILVIAFYGWGLWHQWVKGTWDEVMSIIMKIAIIYVLTLSWGNYSEWLFDLFYKGSEEVAAAAFGSRKTGGNPASEALTTFVQAGFDSTFAIWKAAKWYNLPSFVLGLIIFILTMLVAILALFLLVASKIGIGVLIAIGPFFLAFMLFNATRPWFGNWIALLANYALIAVLAMILLKFMSEMATEYIEELKSKKASQEFQMSFYDNFAFIVFSCIFGVLFLQVQAVAGALVNSIAMAGANAYAGAHGLGFAHRMTLGRVLDGRWTRRHENLPRPEKEKPKDATLKPGNN